MKFTGFFFHNLGIFFLVAICAKFLLWIFPFLESMEVFLTFHLIQLLDVNEKAQTIKTIAWITYVSYKCCPGRKKCFSIQPSLLKI